jgi:uncharacterized protein
MWHSRAGIGRMLVFAASLYFSWGIAVTFLHPVFLYPFTPQTYPLPEYTTVSAPLPDAPAVPLSFIAGSPDAPAVLFFMGNAGSIGVFRPWLDLHRNAGRTVAGMQFRGGAGVPGRPSEARLKADALAAYDWITAETGGPVIVHGYSLGTGLALHVAARREVLGIVLDAPFARLCDLIARATWLPACRMPVQRWDSLADAPRIGAPVLILHGLRDRVIPPAEGQRLADALRASGVQVEQVPLRQGTHENLASLPGHAKAINAFIKVLRRSLP